MQTLGESSRMLFFFSIKEIRPLFNFQFWEKTENKNVIQENKRWCLILLESF